MKRRQFLAQKGDFYAIDDSDKKGSGAARRFAEKLTHTRVDKANVRGLEALAWSTDSVADILDYIHMRVGRDNRNDGWAQNNIGHDLAKYLESLRKEAEEFFSKNPSDDPDDPRQLHLDLCREFIKHLTALYEFYKKPEVLEDEIKK
ncbi:MAG: hypothetical protein HUU32_16920 [Calditrichaceae bacterium]|nr:hypothetical protein [Calditrichia bacterium]NUQ43074.1 hypothetical protein [Calditrichaceae bacterium]